MEMTDLLLPPKADFGKNLNGNHKFRLPSASAASNGRNGSVDDLEDEVEDDREAERHERKCDCKQGEACTHFLTYDLFEVNLLLAPD